MLLSSVAGAANAEVWWISLIVLSFLEVILGVDNIIFVSIVANQLPQKLQAKARNYGLMLALVMRLLLLLGIGFILSLDKVGVLTIPFIDDMHAPGNPLVINVKDLILLAGGVFLIYKSTQEIGDKLEGHGHEVKTQKDATMTSVILQICVVNIVFSFDSILTAIGLTQIIWVMMVAVVVSIAVMMLFSEKVSHFINKHPTMQMLALSFLILIGVMLIAEAFHQHVSKGYLYFAIAFSLGVELLNMRLRKQRDKPVELHGVVEVKEEK